MAERAKELKNRITTNAAMHRQARKRIGERNDSTDSASSNGTPKEAHR